MEPRTARPPLLKCCPNFAAARWPWIVLLVILCTCYYGSYYRHGIEFRDEGGTVALVAKRLVDGEQPFLDVALNYNVMWFYPVVWLYQLFGVSFVLLRVYCFALSTLTVVLAFLAVEKAGRRAWFAFLVALLPLLVPGMTFKNYMPLLAVANCLALLHVALSPPGSREFYWKSLIAGAVLGLTLLIRIEVGLFCGVILIGLHVLRIFDRSAPLLPRFAGAASGIVLAALAAGLLHLPVYLDARQRGFATNFLKQYPGSVSYMESGLRFRLGMPPRAAAGGEPRAIVGEKQEPRFRALATPHAKPATAVAEPSPRSAQSLNREILKRKAWRDFWSTNDTKVRLLTLLTYAPLFSLIPLILWAAVRFGRGIFSPGGDAVRRPLGALVLLGGALTTFPQFFFFRPDSPHLSEFSPGLWVAAFGSCLLLGAAVPAENPLRRWPARLIFILLVLHAGVYLYRMLPDRWTGTYAVRKSRAQPFEAENGVRVFVSKKELAGLQPLLQTIREHSKPGEYLVAYPYHPSLNLLADRPTYEGDVYMDNAKWHQKWDAEAIARFKHYQPAVIVFSDWAINETDASRFSVWAAQTKAWIEQNYVYRGAFMTHLAEPFQVYTRPESLE